MLTLALVASVPRRPGAPAVLAGWLAVALVVICGAAFVSRALPDVLCVEPNVTNDRLSYPLTYWNALGLAAAIGLVLCLHLAAGARRALVQAAGAAATPVLAATLVLTFSRTSLLVAAGAVVLYAVAGRPRGLVGALVVCVPAVAVSVHAALDADLLATVNPTTPTAVDQGGDLARVVAIATAAAFAVRLVLTRLDDLVARLMAGRRARLAAWGAFAVAAAAAAGIALSAGAVDTVRDKVDAFFDKRRDPAGRADPRPPHPGHEQRPRAAVEGRADRLPGRSGHRSGRRHLRLVWDRERPEPTGAKPLMNVVDGHSLYLEVLAELGWPGLLLIGGSSCSRPWRWLCSGARPRSARPGWRCWPRWRRGRSTPARLGLGDAGRDAVRVRRRRSGAGAAGARGGAGGGRGCRRAGARRGVRDGDRGCRRAGARRGVRDGDRRRRRAHAPRGHRRVGRRPPRHAPRPAAAAARRPHPARAWLRAAGRRPVADRPLPAAPRRRRRGAHAG